jgi:FkbM family methyltransferase
MYKLYFDIGANVGEYAKKLLSTKNVDKVICIEANPNIIQTLKNNLSSYSHKLEIVNKAVSSVKENVEFFICQQSNVISTCDLNWKDKSRFSKSTNPSNKWAVTDSAWHKIEIETISIDKLVELYGIPIEIKIDVEGYELNVVKSMSKFYNCLLSFEWAEEKLFEMIETIDYLYELGYRDFNLQFEDKYDYRPIEYINKFDFIDLLNTNCIVDRFKKWGMIFCK